MPHQHGVAMSVRLAVIAPVAALLLSGCLAKTALDVVTLPVKVASAGVDAVTTSQSEADQKRGRDIRVREQKLGKLRREFDELQGQCIQGDRRACEKQSSIRAQMDSIGPA